MPGVAATWHSDMHLPTRVLFIAVHFAAIALSLVPPFVFIFAVIMIGDH
jgi:hypothetical protein